MSLYKQLNIENMTRLWRHYGAMTIPEQSSNIVTNKAWPHKVWVNNSLSLTEKKNAHLPLINIMENNTERTLVTWDENEELIAALHQNTAKLSLTHTSSLIGMSLNLKSYIKSNVFDQKTSNNTCIVSHVVTNQNIKQWINACSKGFGYYIDSQSIYSANQFTQNTFYCYTIASDIVGTALHTNNEGVSGFHQISVLPQWRGQGIAGEIVKHLLTCAHNANACLAVLQASAQGLGVYKKLGFKQDFELKSYKMVTYTN